MNEIIARTSKVECANLSNGLGLGIFSWNKVHIAEQAKTIEKYDGELREKTSKICKSYHGAKASSHNLNHNVQF